MSDFTSTMTDSTSVGDSILSLWNQATLFEAAAELVTDQLATVRVAANAGTIYFPRFGQMANVTSALTNKEDVTSVEITDTAVSILPLEYGAAVTTTKKANLASDGRLDSAATRLVGQNMGSSMDKLAITKLEAFSTTVIYPNAATAASNISTSDVLDKTFANRLYNKLSRKNIPALKDGMYFGVAHEDCLFDLRNEVGAGSWVDVNKYSNATTVLRNEVGMFGGIRWLRSKNVTVTANSNGTIDTYKVNVLGFNALGKAVSEEPHIVISGPFDKLLRFVNVGWFGVFEYGVVDTDNMVQGICASSVGNN
jgi:N4-gp56 family major capsid protein